MGDRAVTDDDTYAQHERLRGHVDLNTEPHGPPPWLGWFMLLLLFLVAGGVTLTVVLAIVHARGAQ